MKVLVTGCAGFIGSRICALLLADHLDVIGVDNLNDAYDSRLKSWRLEQLRPHDNLAFHHADIEEQSSVDRIWKSDGPFDAVINLAARAGVRQSVINPWSYYQTNLTGTLNLLEACRQQGVQNFLLSSTSSLYANAQEPFNEDQTTDTPLSPYAASKKAAETLCYTYHSLYGINVTIPRYFTVYGPAGRPDMSIFRFIRWITEGETVIVYGDGSQSRDFTYVDDIAQGTILALALPGYEIVNLGGDRPVSLNTVIEILEDLVGTKAVVDHQPPLSIDVPSTWADVAKANRLLKWTPQTSLRDGLSSCVQWYQANRKWARDLAL